MIPGDKRRPYLPFSGLGEWWRIMVMGALLATALYFAFFHQSASTDGLGGDTPVITVTVETPEIDPEIVALARDETRQERLVLEAKPLAHLLLKSREVVPSVAKALGIPGEPIPLARLRADPDSYRGDYLWYSGELAYLSTGMSGHPSQHFKIYEGWIKLENGEVVQFRVSVKPQGVKVGDFVRVEGFFLKLRDSHHLPQAELSPVLVGPELFPDYPSWDIPEQLDPAVLATVNDGKFENGSWTDFGDMRRPMTDSLDPPLWHLTAFARGERETLNLPAWRKVPAFTTKDQLDDIRLGRFERGGKVRILGSFVLARCYEVHSNPLGEQFWTEAWIQVRDLGSKLIPIWIPGRLDPSWQRNTMVEVRGYYHRGLAYEPMESQERWTPVFVADQLDRFQALPQHVSVAIMKWTFFGLVIAVIGLFFSINRRDRQRRQQHEFEMSQRRRKRTGILVTPSSKA